MDALAAYRTGVEQIATVVEDAGEQERDPAARLSAGLRAALELLAGDPRLAHLLLVDPLAVASPLRVEHERSLTRLGRALVSAGPPEVSEDLTRLVAGGLVSYLSSRVVAGEAANLLSSYELLRAYLLAGADAATSSRANERPT